MRILIVSNGADNGGVGIGIKRAFERYTDWDVRSVTRAQNFMGFEQDIFWPPGGPSWEVDELYRKADVVHVMDKFEAVKAIPSFEGLATKSMVMHHHGSIFRSRPEGFIEECRRHRIQALVATFDLLRFAPGELEWLPNPVDIDQMQEFRLAYRRQPRLKVVHTPGAGDNGTDALHAAYNESPTPYDLEVVRHKPWVDCMRRKATADVLFDSLDIGYGLTSIEAFAMGIPVLSGADEETERRIIEHIGFLPYFSVARDSLAAGLESMMEDSVLRAEVGQRGMQVAEGFHSQKQVVDRLKVIYQRARG